MGSFLCLALISLSFGQDKIGLQPKSLTLYTARTSDLLEPVLRAYQEKTGVVVKVVNGEAGPLLQKLKSEGGKSPADLFMTVDGGNLVQATKLGLLRPLSAAVKSLPQVPAAYRDDQGLWVGLSLRARTLFYDSRKVGPTDLRGYSSLAEPRWRKQLCLRTSRKVYNQSLVAGLIGRIGAEEAERVVRGWVKNLALPVFTSDNQLLEAMEQGKCAVGIANSYYLARLQAEGKAAHVRPHWPKAVDGGVHVNISGVGVVKTSQKAELAEALVEWLLSSQAQKIFADANHEYPVMPAVPPTAQVKSWGSFDPDPTPISALFNHQSQAVKLMDRAGYL